MTRVIGKDVREVHQVTCRNCASIVEYTKDELERRVHIDYTGGKDYHHGLECPQCSNFITVRIS